MVEILSEIKILPGNMPDDGPRNIAIEPDVKVSKNEKEPRYKRTMRNSDIIFEYADPFMLEEQIRDLIPCDVEPEEEKDEEF